MKQSTIKTVILFFTLFAHITFLSVSCTDSNVPEEVIIEEEKPLTLTKTIPIGANSWVIDNITQDEALITKGGIHNWQSLDDVIRTYIKTGAGELHVGFKIKSADGTSKIKVTVGDSSKEITLSNSDYKTEEVGKFTVAEGYNYIEIQGLEKSGEYIADVNELLVGGPAVKTGMAFVPTDNFHFGRRGPSVHMSYDEASGKAVKWFYNEVTVPEGEDQIGSFFMANGHSQGYFGMQVNSETERRVLFSIWSAFDTNDPNQIPDDYKVEILGTGTGVTAQNFGNEGSGVQSFKDVGWKAGVTYKFLLKGDPSVVSGSTDYTAYFYDPEVGDWQIIASLRRPKTSVNLSGLHSFLENFKPSTGYRSRQVKYGNQWIYTTDGVWTELTKGRFTADATARNGDRFDFEGGTSGNTFFLKNCGFFNADVQPDTHFTRSASGTAPNIDFSKLPKPQTPEPPAQVNLIDRTGWAISDFSSQEDQGGEGETGRAADVLDGNLETYWHSCWNGGCTATAPHHLTIDMGAEIEVGGIRFAQRQSLARAVKDMELQISTDNSTWESLGDFVLQNIAAEQDIDLSEAKTFRYLKFIAKTAHDGAGFAAMAEIKPYTK